MPTLTPLEKKILNLLQTNLPLLPRPFQNIGEKIGISEEIVIQTLQSLKERGYIRRIGAFFSSEKLGYHGTLIALEVDPKELPRVANFVNGFPNITHNYERSGSAYNLWFTLLTKSQAEEEHILQQIISDSAVKAHLNLKSEYKSKVNVNFHLK